MDKNISRSLKLTCSGIVLKTSLLLIQLAGSTAQAQLDLNHNNMPKDQGLRVQYGLYNYGQVISQQPGVQGADISARQAWLNAPIGQAGDCRKTPIAVIDSGQSFNHPDLANSIDYNSGELGKDDFGNDKRTNGIDDDQNGFIDDYQGWNFLNDNNDVTDELYHGTHVSGIIGAEANNLGPIFGINAGITGVCQKAKIFMIKTSDPTGNNSIFDIIEAIYYMADFRLEDGELKYKVSNHSYGGPGFSAGISIFEDAIEAYTNAGNKGGLYIASAGNFGWDNDDWTGCNPQAQYNCWGYYPSDFPLPRIISVAATNNRDELASFSNWGSAGSVDIAAPGEQIFSTTPLVQSLFMINNGFAANYEFVDGTSMAAPMVVGAAANLWSLHPHLTADQVKNKILNSGDQLPSLVGKVLFESRLNLYKVTK